MASSLLLRAIGFSIVWLALAGTSAADMPAGIVGVAVASIISLRLVPAGERLSLPGTVRFALRFVAQSLWAGVDVARRAFAPALPLSPGFLTYQTAWPASLQRDALAASMSLQPGTLPVGTEGERGLVIHCLDVRGPVAGQLAADEAAFIGMLGGRNRDG